MAPVNEELVAKFSRVQQAVSQVRVQRQGWGVAVESDGDGRLTNLSFSPEALTAGPQALVNAVMHLYQQAAQESSAQAQHLMTELHDDPLVNRLAALTDRQIADTEPTAPSTPQPSSAASTAQLRARRQREPEPQTYADFMRLRSQPQDPANQKWREKLAAELEEDRRNNPWG